MVSIAGAKITKQLTAAVESERLRNEFEAETRVLDSRGGDDDGGEGKVELPLVKQVSFSNIHFNFEHIVSQIATAAFEAMVLKVRRAPNNLASEFAMFVQ